MGKGCQPRKGHNAAKQRKNYDEIDWSKPEGSSEKLPNISDRKPVATSKDGKITVQGKFW